MTDDSTDDEREPSPAIASAVLTYTLDEDERPSEAVVRAVASLTDTRVLDLDPLYDMIDIDHLNGLFGESGESELLADSSVTFQFNGCEVTVTPDIVYVRESAGDTT